MGWKNVKEHYGITHLVQVDKRKAYDNEPCIFIGSAYISDIIVIRVSDGKLLKRYTEGKRINEKLAMLQPRLDEDEKNGVLKSLIDEEDKFERLLPVYCIDAGRHIVKMWCEKYGWPNTTTDGKLMYDNIFYSQLRAAKYRLLSTSKMRWDIWWYNVRNKFSNIWREIKGFKWSFEEISTAYMCAYGVFFTSRTMEKKERRLKLSFIGMRWKEMLYFEHFFLIPTLATFDMNEYSYGKKWVYRRFFHPLHILVGVFD